MTTAETPMSQLERDLTQEITVVSRRRDEMEQRATAADHQVEELIEELNTFRSRVRDEAIRVAREMDWCDNGLNRTLDNLGLEPYERIHEVTAVIELRLKVENAESHTVARRWVQNSVHASSDDGDIEVDDSSLTIRSVSGPVGEDD